MIERLASTLYETYCKAVGGRAFNGDTLPDWPTFRSDPAKKKQSDAWMEAALEAARSYHGTPQVEALALLQEIYDSGYLRAKLTSDTTGMEQRLGAFLQSLLSVETATCRPSGNPSKAAPGIGMPLSLYLQAFGEVLQAAFGETPYHVGSSLKRGSPTWRDVDVRIMLDKEKYEAMGFGDPKSCHENDRWSAYVMAFSELGRRMTGLPIDFQIQETSDANAEYRGAEHHPRSALILHRIRRHHEYKKWMADTQPDVSAFIPVSERLPEPCVPVIGYSARWVDEDFNPQGLRECFRTDEGTWISARWNNYQDVYDTDEGPGPESWMAYPVPK